MTNIKNILKRALKTVVNETLESKADKLIEKIQKMEMDEMYDDPSLEEPGLKDSKDVMSKFFKKSKYEMGSKFEPRHSKFGGSKFGKSREKKDDQEGMELAEGEMCECGGMMREGECTECGSMKESLYKKTKPFGKKTPSFDYIQEEEDEIDRTYKDSSFTPDKNACRQAREDAQDEAGMKHAKQVCQEAGIDIEGEMKEGSKFTRMLAKTPKGGKFKMNGRTYTDTSDYDEGEVEEGNAFTRKLGRARKGDKFSMNGKTYTDTSDYDVNESIVYHIKDNYGDVIKLNEEEMIDLIENIVLKETEDYKPKSHPGLTTYQKAHKQSGKENNDYIKSVTKKLKDVIGKGSKGKFDMNPDYFPMGNGELGKMSKKGFEISKEMEDFNYSLAGQNFPNSDGIQFDEKRMKKYYEGDSTTGNAPGGNALKSKANKRFNELREKNTLKKLKDQSYKRVSQPVFDEKYEEDGKLNLKMETVNEKKINQLNEEFDRIKDLLSYNRKTQ